MGIFFCLTCDLLSKYKNAVSNTTGLYMCVSYPISYFLNMAKFGSDWEWKPVGIVKTFSRPPESSLVQVCVCMTHAGSDLQVHSTGSHVERRAFTLVPTILGPHHPIHKSKSCSNSQPPTLILLPLWHLESLQLWSSMPGIPGMLKVLLGIVSSDGNTRTQPSSHSYYRIPIAHSTKLPRTPLLRTEGLPPMLPAISLFSDNKNILTKALTKVRPRTSAMAVNTGRAHWIYSRKRFWFTRPKYMLHTRNVLCASSHSLKWRWIKIHTMYILIKEKTRAN